MLYASSFPPNHQPPSQSSLLTHTLVLSVGCLTCLTLCDTMDCSPPGSSVHGILQARILEWVVIPFSRVSSQPRDQTWGIRGEAEHVCARILLKYTLNVDEENKVGGLGGARCPDREFNWKPWGRVGGGVRFPHTFPTSSRPISHMPVTYPAPGERTVRTAGSPNALSSLLFSPAAWEPDRKPGSLN